MGSSKLTYKNNFDYAYHVLKEAIMSFELEPEASISVGDVSEKLQVSKLPIKIALAKLQDEHLVDIIPKVGSYVSTLKEDLINQATFMRLPLEKEVLKLACESFPDKELVKLKKNVENQKVLLTANGSAWDFQKLDMKFHEIIFRATQKADVWESISRLSTHYNRMKFLIENECGYTNSIEEHEQIVFLIENKKVDEIESVINQHIMEPIKRRTDLDVQFLNYFDYSSN